MARCGQESNEGLSSGVSIGYTKTMKDVGLRVRVERDLRDEFLETCRAQDTPAAQVIREFMRSYVARLVVETRVAAKSRVRKRVGRKVAGA
jgi:hypothetical protein